MKFPGLCVCFCAWLSLAAISTFAEIAVGKFPLTESQLVPRNLSLIVLDQLPVVYVAFEGWSLAESINAFGLSKGFDITDATRKEMDKFAAGIKNYVEDAGQNLTKSLTPDSILVPVVVKLKTGNAVLSFLQCERTGDFVECSRRFLSQFEPEWVKNLGANVTAKLSAQLTVRAKSLDTQFKAFPAPSAAQQTASTPRRPLHTPTCAAGARRRPSSHPRCRRFRSC